jgi:hypothetical protein
MSILTPLIKLLKNKTIYVYASFPLQVQLKYYILPYFNSSDSSSSVIFQI